jgi:hypothetical protein
VYLRRGGRVLGGIAVNVAHIGRRVQIESAPAANIHPAAVGAGSEGPGKSYAFQDEPAARPNSYHPSAQAVSVQGKPPDHQLAPVVRFQRGSLKSIGETLSPIP